MVVTGPASLVAGTFPPPSLNGIAASPDGKTLIVANSAIGRLYTVNPETGASAAITGGDVSEVDGILFEAGLLWAVQTFQNQVTELRLSADLSSATVERVITNPRFQVPTAVARDGSRLAVVNGKYDTGYPPAATTFEVVIVNRSTRVIVQDELKRRLAGCCTGAAVGTFTAGLRRSERRCGASTERRSRRG